MSVDLTFVRKHPNECEETVRRGEFEPCDKPAVAVRIDPDSGDAYPVCAHHARAVMVPLANILEVRS